MPTTFDPARHRRDWAALDFAQRRAILKAVNRGRTVEDRRDAMLAVGAARNQMRFWRWVWLIGPLTAIAQINRGLAQVLANLFVATLVLGLMSWWFYRRAAAAHEANLELASRGKDNTPPKKSASEPRKKRTNKSRRRRRS